METSFLRGKPFSRLLLVLACFEVVTGYAQNLPPVSLTAAAYEQFALQAQGDATRGRQIFTNVQTAACIRCHTTDGSGVNVAPDLYAIADKFSRQDLIRSVLEPSSTIAVGYDTTIIQTKSDEEYQGVIKQATDAWIELMGWDAKVYRVATSDIASRHPGTGSFMPSGLEKTMTQQDFADLIAYLETLHQPVSPMGVRRGMPETIPQAARPVVLEPFFGPGVKLEHPLWFGLMPGYTNRFVVLEHAGKSWVIERTPEGDKQTSLLDLSGTVRFGGATGLLGLAFHPKFAENRRYFLKYQILEAGRIYTLLVERRFAPDFHGDSGEPGRQLLKILGVTQDHNGGCITFGPDGYLYLGMGDTGPQRDPQGHGQDLGILLGKILRLDVDHADEGQMYGIPSDNPFRNQPGARPEIWAYGFREPWRFSFDRSTSDLWVGDVGQDSYEEAGIVRAAENHGWNVFEGVVPYSDRYRRESATYIPPVFCYSHRDGVSVTGGYVYRGTRAPDMAGRYICGDFETRRIWALTQTNRLLTGVVEIGRAPSRIVSFAQDPTGELYLVGYDNGVIYRMDLSSVDPAPIAKSVLVGTSERTPVRWRFTLQEPATNWVQSVFDDAAWNYAPGGFGTAGTPGAVVRTEWNTSNIWLRREFEVRSNSSLSQPRSLALRIHHDEDAEVYLNGVEAARLPRWTSGYVEVPLTAEAVHALHAGRNSLAIHCRQNSGGQYIDAGLVEYLRAGNGKMAAAKDEKVIR